MKLKDKVVVITGAAGGIGNEIIKSLSNSHASLALVDKDEEKLMMLSKHLSEKNAFHKFYTIEVNNEAKVIDCFKTIIADFGSLDVLINNAGITQAATTVYYKNNQIKKMSYSAWSEVIDVNLTGTFLCGREAIEKMILAGKGGCIINISSICRVGTKKQANYSASKAGVVALGETWAKENAAYGIRTASIAPGYIDIDMVHKMPDEEIAHAVKYVIENDFVNGGTVLEVNGGMRL